MTELAGMQQLMLALAFTLAPLIPVPACLAADVPVTALQFSTDGRSVVAGSQAGVEIVHGPAKGKRFAIEFENVNDLKFSHDGKLLAIAGGSPGESGDVRVVSWPGGDLVAEFTPQVDVVYSIAWSHDDRTIAAASHDSTISMLDVETATETIQLLGHSRGVTSVCWMDDAQLVSGSIDNNIRIWNVADKSVVRTLKNHTRPVSGISIRRGSGLPMLSSVSDDRTVRFWQPTIGRLVRFKRLDSPAHAVVWTSDGSGVVVGCDDGSVRSINVQTLEVGTISAHTSARILSLAISPDGRRLAVGDSSGNVKLESF